MRAAGWGHPMEKGSARVWEEDGSCSAVASRQTSRHLPSKGPLDANLDARARMLGTEETASILVRGLCDGFDVWGVLRGAAEAGWRMDWAGWENSGSMMEPGVLWDVPARKSQHGRQAA